MPPLQQQQQHVQQLEQELHVVTQQLTGATAERDRLSVEMAVVQQQLLEKARQVGQGGGEAVGGKGAGGA